MGFIEGLRQQKEAEWKTKREQEDALIATEKTREAVRLQKEVQERELHQQRRQQAETYFQESEVESLIAELGKIIGGSYGWLSEPPKSRFSEGGWFSSATSDYRRLPALATDPDSLSFGIVWDETSKASKTARAPIGTYHGGITQSAHSSIIESWTEFEGKFIAVEAYPDGGIIFHARKDIRIPESNWKNSKDILDSALEQAYNNPRIQKYNGHFSRYFPDGGD